MGEDDVMAKFQDHEISVEQLGPNGWRVTVSSPYIFEQRIAGQWVPQTGGLLVSDLDPERWLEALLDALEYHVTEGTFRIAVTTDGYSVDEGQPPGQVADDSSDSSPNDAES